MIFEVINAFRNPVNKSFLDGNQQFRLTISNTNKKMTDVMKEKLNPLVEEYKRTNSKPK